ncbi:hypothetical protein CsSME_00051722 [Camellia sinensis var. sinensis]
MALVKRGYSMRFRPTQMQMQARQVERMKKKKGTCLSSGCAYHLRGAWLSYDYNGSQLWDTAFVVQAILSTNHAEKYGPTLMKSHTYIKKLTGGAWAFSTADHGWPIFDCTAEGLKVIIDQMGDHWFNGKTLV